MKTGWKMITMPGWRWRSVWCAAPRLQYGDNTRGPAGFTLLEVILAMTIVTVIVMMVVNMHQEAAQAWRIGVSTAEVDSAGRAVVEFMARELSQAVAGPMEAEGISDKYHWFSVLDEGREVCFVALTGDPNRSTHRRTLRITNFRLHENCLKYCRRTDSSIPSGNPYNLSEGGWASFNHSGEAVLVTNIVRFQINVLKPEDLKLGDDYEPVQTYNSNSLPAALDIMVEALSEDDMVRYKALGEDDTFRQRNSRRYMTRVHFFNRQGYAAR